MIDWGFIPFTYNVFSVYRADTPFGLMAFQDDDFREDIDPEYLAQISHNMNGQACIDRELIVSFYSDGERLFTSDEIYRAINLAAKRAGWFKHRYQCSRFIPKSAITAYTFNYDATDLSIEFEGDKLILVSVSF